MKAEKESRFVDNEKMMIEGRNAVLEALRAGKTVEHIYLEKEAESGVLSSVIAKAREKNIDVRYVTRAHLDSLSETGHHQGVMARLSAFSYSTVEEILDEADKAGEKPFLILLDGIEDPHNLGAIIRSAHQFGCHGILLPKDRSALLTGTVAKVSAGAIHYMKIAKVVNLTRTIDELKKKGIWFAAADMDGEALYKTDLTGPIGLVIGAEGKGISRLVKEHCDFTVSIPMYGKIDSLNASVSAGIFAYEVTRQRKK